MKKHLNLFVGVFSLIVLLPAFAFAQMWDSFSVGFFIPLIFIIVFYGLFFLAIRGIVLWYFRINDRLDNQERQIELLKAIHLELKLLRRKED